MEWKSTTGRLRVLFFRVWTAGFILALYIFGWFYTPETLTWWKRTSTAIIEGGCNLLPYPWGDRIETTLGNFGLWVQITLAIAVFRLLVWLVLLALRRLWQAREPDRETVASSPTGYR